MQVWVEGDYEFLRDVASEAEAEGRKPALYRAAALSAFRNTMATLTQADRSASCQPWPEVKEEHLETRPPPSQLLEGDGQVHTPRQRQERHAPLLPTTHLLHTRRQLQVKPTLPVT